MAEELITGIRFQLSYEPQAFLYGFCTPIVIEIDGETFQKSWGTHLIEVKPGRHTVKIYFSYFFWPECGANSIEVAVKEGDIVKINYHKNPSAFASGRIEWL